MATVKRKSSPRVMPVFFSRCLFTIRSVCPYEWLVSSEVVSSRMEVNASQRLMSRVARAQKVYKYLEPQIQPNFNRARALLEALSALHLGVPEKVISIATFGW